MKSASRLLSCVFLISMAALALEIVQMRIFAYALWHHLAFLVISIAILGFGAAGSLLSVFRPLLMARPERTLAWASLLFALSALAGPLVLSIRPVDIFGQVKAREMGVVVLYYLVFMTPYLFAGMVIALALTVEARRAGRLYFVNMVGSGLGCLVLLAALGPYGAPGCLLLIAAAGALAAFLVLERGALKVVAGLATLACLGLLPFAEQVLEIRLAQSKLMAIGQRLPGTEVLASRWTPLGRVDAVKTPGFDGLVLFQDGDAMASMLAPSAPIAKGQIHAVGYAITEKPRVLIVGAGGGFDVRIAREAGASRITGVEINPAMLGFLLDPRFAHLSGQPQLEQHIDLHLAEGRHYLRSSKQTYDLIQLSGVDTYTALSSGAYVLSESYLYTKEAFQDYLARLAPDGLLTIIRFAFPAPRETLRTMVMAMQALQSEGAAEPWKHLVVIRAGLPHDRGNPFITATGFGAVLVKRSPFRSSELDQLRAWSDAGEHIKDYFPDEEGRFTPAEIERLQELIHLDLRYRDYKMSPDGLSPFHAFAEAFRAGRTAEFLAAYPYDVRPVTDDAPFFFNQHRFRAVYDWVLGRAGRLTIDTNVPWKAHSPLFQTRPIGLILLFLTLGQLALLVAALIFVPLLFLPRRESRGAAPLGYFFCLGLAYIFLMISSMQRFGLILGHPSYSISVTMATFLIGSGLGALVSGKIDLRAARPLLCVIAVLLTAGTAVLHHYLPALSAELLARPFWQRAGATVALLAPFAFLMGMCFPTGIRILARGRASLIPWAYGINGGASVLGSVLAVLLAMTLGFSRVQWIAAGIYVLAALLMLRMACRMEPEQEQIAT